MSIQPTQSEVPRKQKTQQNAEELTTKSCHEKEHVADSIFYVIVLVNKSLMLLMYIVSFAYQQKRLGLHVQPLFHV